MCFAWNMLYICTVPEIFRFHCSKSVSCSVSLSVALPSWRVCFIYRLLALLTNCLILVLSNFGWFCIFLQLHKHDLLVKGHSLIVCFIVWTQYILEKLDSHGYSHCPLDTWLVRADGLFKTFFFFFLSSVITALCQNTKHQFTTSFLKPLPWLVTP